MTFQKFQQISKSAINWEKIIRGVNKNWLWCVTDELIDLVQYFRFNHTASTTWFINVTHRQHMVRLLSHDSYVQTLALGHLTSHQSCLGSGLWATLNFVAFCLDWPPALGPEINFFCSDQDPRFSAIAGGPPLTCNISNMCSMSAAIQHVWIIGNCPNWSVALLI